MKESPLEETLVEVWRQTLVENVSTVVFGAQRFPVRHTPKRNLREVDFVFDMRGTSRPGAERTNEIALGADGALGQKGDAISKGGPLRGQCRGRLGNALRGTDVKQGLSLSFRRVAERAQKSQP